MSRTNASLLVLLAAAIWGTGFYYQKAAMAHVGPLQFLGFRGVLACLALAPFAWQEAKNSPPTTKSLWPISILGGIIFFCAGLLQQNGLYTATLTNSGFLTALYVVITPILLWVFLGQKPAALLWLAVAMAAGGIWALGGGGITAFSRGDGLIAASALFWSLHMVVTSKSTSHGRPMQFTLMVFVVLALIGCSTALVVETVQWQAIRDAAVSILYVGLLASAACYALVAVAAKHIPMSYAALLLSTETLFSAAVGHVALGETLTPLGWFGALLLLSAVVLVQVGGAPKKPTASAAGQLQSP